MQTHGGVLYRMRKTDQILLFVVITPNGLKSSLANARLTFHKSDTNQVCVKSNFFQASESQGCINILSLLVSVARHLISSSVFDEKNNPCNRGFNGK